MFPLREISLGMLCLFVYGSLRRGENNHGQLAADLLSAERFSVPGRMRLRPEGYPALLLDPRLSVASGNPYNWEHEPLTECRFSVKEEVDGELLWLRDSPEVGRRLDDFEGFRPQAPCDYLRVACCWRGRTFWTYVAPEERPDWPLISAWPPPEWDGRPWRPSAG